MKKYLILLFALLLSTSFKIETQEKWIGTFEVFLNEENELVVYYRGTLPQCLSKKALDVVYENCDTVKYTIEDVERGLGIRIEIDTCHKNPKPIKTIRM